MKRNGFWNKQPTFDAAGEGAPAAGDPATPAPADAAPATPAAGDTPASAPATPAPAAQDFAWIPEEYRGDEGPDMEAFQTHYQDLLTNATQASERAAAVPEDGNYPFAVPDDIDFGEMVLPENYQVQIDVENEAYKPLFGELGAFLQESGLPADAAPKMMGLLAKYTAAQDSAQYQAATSEYERMGANDAARGARIASVQRSLESRLPAEQAKALMAATQSYEGVRALETIFAPRGPGQTPQQQAAPQTREQQLAAYYAQPTS